MRIPGAKTAGMVYRWIRARLRGGALILGYHQIAYAPSDGYEICVSPGHFAEQMDVLRNYANIISMTQLVKHLKDSSIPPRAVAVTFDDGYADNFYEAKSSLEKYDVPATIFVCSGFVGGEFWWDELQRVVMHATADPQTLRLVNQGQDIDFQSGDRKRFSQMLYRRLLPMDIPQRNEAMQIIRSWAGADGSEMHSLRSMNHAELAQLSNCELIEIGSHTRNHPMLHHLTQERQAQEILWGRQDLESIIGKPVTGFSYPNGWATGDAKSILQQHGFAYACTSPEDVVRAGQDRFELTRFWQKDVDGDTFLRNLRLWWKQSQA